jgi:OmpA-OmpF porin, OOP family
MKYVLLPLFLLTFFSCFSQDELIERKKPTLYVQLNSLDFKTPTDISSTSIGNVLSNGRWKNLGQNYSGIGINFWTGITSKLDFAASFNATKVYYPFRNDLNYRTKRNLYETDITFNLKLFDDNRLVVPYLTAGIGGYIYANTNGSYAPFGSGIQVNIRNKVFVNASFQYRAPVTYEVRGHFVYGLSVGIPIFQKLLHEEVNLSTSPQVSSEPYRPVMIIRGLYDRDSDGVPDSTDMCPTVPGIVALNGCPPSAADRDNDGIVDSLDKCPTEAGVPATGGCPLVDGDKDGIPDVVDQCPDKPGPASNFGCPAVDSSLLINSNKNDSATGNKGVVRTPATTSPISPKTTTKLSNKPLYIYEVFFYEGLTIIPDASYNLLNGVVELMKQNPDIRLVLRGYADGQEFGTNAKASSAKRAYAVYSYFLDRGIDKSRMSVLGYGSANPKATNLTPVGRSQNRRVEIRILKK